MYSMRQHNPGVWEGNLTFKKVLMVATGRELFILIFEEDILYLNG